jgi:hypothetical protein
MRFHMRMGIVSGDPRDVERLLRVGISPRTQADGMMI